MTTGDYAQDTKQMFIPAQNVYLSVPLMDSTHGYWMTLMMMLSFFSDWEKGNRNIPFFCTIFEIDQNALSFSFLGLFMLIVCVLFANFSEDKSTFELIHTLFTCLLGLQFKH